MASLCRSKMWTTANNVQWSTINSGRRRGFPACTLAKTDFPEINYIKHKQLFQANWKKGIGQRRIRTYCLSVVSLADPIIEVCIMHCIQYIYIYICIIKWIIVYCPSEILIKYYDLLKMSTILMMGVDAVAKNLVWNWLAKNQLKTERWSFQ